MRARPEAAHGLVGAVHIAQGLTPIACLAGYDVTVIDPRSAFATPERFADCKVIAQWPQDVFVTRPVDRYTAMVVLSHVPDIDDEGIKAALAGECFYIGALGSRKTNAARLERLRAQNIPEPVRREFMRPSVSTLVPSARRRSRLRSSPR